jgi:hypothetical protein
VISRWATVANDLVVIALMAGLYVLVRHIIHLVLLNKHRARKA